jgi:transposase
MLGDVSGVRNIYIVTGHTDMRKSIDGLVAIIRDVFMQDPFSNSLFLFCGRRCDRIKALHYEKDGFCLLYKRLNRDSGRFQWPRSSSEMKPLTRKQFAWLMDGLAIEQPGAIKVSKNDGI